MNAYSNTLAEALSRASNFVTPRAHRRPKANDGVRERVSFAQQGFNAEVSNNLLLSTWLILYTGATATTASN